MTTIQKKVQKKVEEVNKLIELASNSESENSYDGNLMVVNSGSTWQEPMVYKPIKFTNGVLYIEYYEPYSKKTTKEKILSKHLELDGYGTLLDIAKMYRKALREENIKFSNGGALIGNQKRIDLNHNSRIDAEDFKLLRSSMNGAWRNEHKHVNHNQDHEVRYARKRPARTGYKGKRNFEFGGDFQAGVYAKGGSLQNHGLKIGDTFIKTIFGGIQKVKDKDGNIVYVNLANGERSSDVPLPFNEGGKVEKEVTYFVNKDGIKVRSVAKPDKDLTQKEWMAKHSESREARAYAFGGGMSRAYSPNRSVHANKGNFNRSLANRYSGGGKVTFKEKSSAIAKKFVGKRVEPKYQKEYGKTYDAKEAKEVGNKIAGAQKAKYDSKMSNGGEVSNILKNAKNASKKYGYEYYVYSNKEGDFSFARKSEFERLFDKDDLKILYKIDGDKVENLTKKAENGIVVSKRGNGSIMLKAKEIRKEGESWKDALKRAGAMLKK